MAEILEILRGLSKSRAQGNPARQGVRSGIILGTNGQRYSVNDGSNTIICDSLVGERLRPGDRVWLGEGPGVSLILGLQGKDKDFAGG